MHNGTSDPGSRYINVNFKVEGFHISDLVQGLKSNFWYYQILNSNCWNVSLPWLYSDIDILQQVEPKYLRGDKKIMHAYTT